MKNRILIITGTHGNEQSAVQLGLTLVNEYRNEGHIDVIPFLNLPGLISNTREVSSTSTTDLNRSFGDEEESYAEIVKRLKQDIRHYDYVIDIHNSPRCANFCLIDKGSRANQIANICKEAGVEYATRYSNGGTIKDYAIQKGKIGITYEFAGMSTFRNGESFARAYMDISSLIKVIENKPRTYEISTVNEQELHSAYSLTTGFVQFNKDVNDIAAPGETLFTVLNEEAVTIERVTNMESKSIKMMALGTSFTTRGSSVLQYIIKD